MRTSSHQAFHVAAHNHARQYAYTAIAESSGEAAEAAAQLFGDEPCSITVIPLKDKQ